MNDKVKYRVIVIGASVGNLQAVVKIIGRFKPRKNSVFLVALHGFSGAPPVLAEHIGRQIEMPISYARNEMEIITGQVFLAPPDHHLMVKDNTASFGTRPFTYSRKADGENKEPDLAGPWGDFF